MRTTKNLVFAAVVGMSGALFGCAANNASLKPEEFAAVFEQSSRSVDTLLQQGNQKDALKMLDELAASAGTLSRQLAPGCVTETRPSPMTQAAFLWQHHQDPMAVEKLAEGIRLFAVDQVKLEQQIQQML